MARGLKKASIARAQIRTAARFQRPLRVHKNDIVFSYSAHTSAGKASEAVDAIIRAIIGETTRFF
jgi:hypothetical protein